MKAYAIKSKEGKYFAVSSNDYKHYWTTIDFAYYFRELNGTLLAKQEAEEFRDGRYPDCEVVEITIAEGDLEQEIEDYKKALSGEMFINFKLPMEHAQFKRQLAEKDEEIEELKTSIDYWKNEVFKKMEVKLAGVTKEKIQEIRKQVCDEIRNAFKKQFRDGMCGGRFEQVVPIDCFNSILDQIEKGSDNE